MASNNPLNDAKKGKMDEFYTQIPDIEKELSHYAPHFKGKTVYCNCDDPRVSNFFFYFRDRFHELGLKRLIASCYKPQEFDFFSESSSENAVWVEYDGSLVDGRPPTAEELGLRVFEGDGDFRGRESIELLKQSDIVCTNPPFSLFREYIAQLMDYGKKFLVVGNYNAIKYKEIFPLIKENRLWTGITGGSMVFKVPQDYPEMVSRYWVDETGQKWRSMGNTYWFTNLEHEKRNERLSLVEKYSPEKYPKYDGYDAIEVAETKLIPYDYDGVMGVPITFLDKYCPEQFEVIGELNHGCDNEYDLGVPVLDGKQLYVRILIRRKQ